MAALKRARRTIEAAWRAFVADGHLARSVRPEIQRSWQRARVDWRVDPTLRACPSAAADAVAEAEAAEAYRAASALVAEFGERLGGDGHVVGYFDASGVMLALHGNARTRARLEDVNFAPGACWSEHAAGTNGIGTALVEARPVQVFASEHFVEAWQPWACASVPVRAGGEVVGVVDITSPWTAYHPALLLTAESLARAVESRLEAEAARRQSAAARRLADDALRGRDEFLAVASHELKTPLTPLQLKLQRLMRVAERADSPIDPAALADALRDADRQLARVVEFMDDLLDVAQLAHEPMRLATSRTDLGAVVRRVVERLRSALARQGCDVALAVRGEVVGSWDARRLDQALRHLLVNAMKYAPGRIDVTVEADGARARVVVRDHGPGIPAEAQARIFLPFERAVSYRHGAGCGIGLHAVRRIVEAHGGAVRVDSVVGSGTAFVVELPLDPGTPG